MLRASIDRLLHVCAKPCIRERRWRVRDGLAIEPCRTRGRHLPFDVEIRSDGQHHPVATARVLEFSELDDRSRLAVPGGVESGQRDMMNTTIDAVDHRESSTA